MELSSKQGRPLEEAANMKHEPEAMTSPSDSLNGPHREPEAQPYRNDPRFRKLLQQFQNAQWDECQSNISQLLGAYPEDSSLLAFKQDVELRLRQQQSSKEQQEKEHRKQRHTAAIRILMIAVVGLVVLFSIIGAVKGYQARQLEQQAALNAESLLAQYQLADSFMRAGKPDEALRLYHEIERADPQYQDIDQKIDAAEQAITVIELYHEGVDAFQGGKSDRALEIFLKVEELHPKYRDTPQLIQQIQQEQQIALLVSQIETSYSQGDWEQVVHNYEAIQEMGPSIDLPDLKEKLFVSYRELILAIAGRSDLTSEELETAEKYYRRALALFPQDREHAEQRDELQTIAVELLANKYYLNGISLLESSNYSVEGVQESIRILTRASNIGPESPAIATEIENAQLFLDSYDDLLQQRWDEAISGFETLRRRDEDYADGRVKYFLYEALTARGDRLFAFADFEGAFTDYQDAEKIAWGDQGNSLRLFQIETRIAATLRKLGRLEEAAEYYHFAYTQVGYRERLTGPGEQELLQMLAQADRAYEQGNAAEAVRLYEIAMQQEQEFFDQRTITVNEGDTLVNIAFQNGATIEELRAANQLGESMIILQDQEFLSPVVSAPGP